MDAPQLLTFQQLEQTCTVEAVSGIRGLAEAEGRGSIRGCLRSREWLCRVGYLVYSAGCIICTGNFAQYGYLYKHNLSILGLDCACAEEAIYYMSTLRSSAVTISSACLLDLSHVFKHAGPMVVEYRQGSSRKGLDMLHTSDQERYGICSKSGMPGCIFTARQVLIC